MTDKKVIIIPEGAEVFLKDSFDGIDAQEIHVPKSVLKIESNAFSPCKNLRKITFTPESQLTEI